MTEFTPREFFELGNAAAAHTAALEKRCPESAPRDKDRAEAQLDRDG